MTRVQGLPHLVWLVAVWIALWGELSVPNLASGLLVAAAILLLRPERTRRRGRLHPVAAARFLGYFLWKLVEASVSLAWEVVTPRNHLREGIVAVPLRGPSDALVTVVADAITLTPGTVTLDVERDPVVLYLHVLHLDDEEELRREVQHLEALVIAAFGSDDDRAALGHEPRASLTLSQSTEAATGTKEDDQR